MPQRRCPAPTGGRVLPGRLHFAPKAKHVIYLHMVGGPPQMDLYDYKPKMNDWYDKDLPDSIRMGQRLTTMTSGQTRFPIAPSKYKFAQHGKCGMWVSELLPYTAKMVDDMCFIRSMHTEAINHEPAITYMQTGNQITGRPCLGSWVSYGLGSLNENLPTFVVLVAKPTNTEQVQAISARLWSSGYLPGEHAGVSFRSGGDPILYINNPPGVPAEVRRNTLDGLKALERDELPAGGRSRDAHPHPAIRAGLPHAGQRAGADRHRAASRSRPTSSTATTAKQAGHASPTRRCWPGGWSSAACGSCRSTTTTGTRTATSPAGCPTSAATSTSPATGLIQDLKARGLLDETLVIWGGEFGRTIYSQGGLSHDNYGRDHHPRCFTMWMAGGGSQAGARSTARPTTSPTTSSRTRSTSTTSTPRCCTCWASTTSGSRTATRGSTSG